MNAEQNAKILRDLAEKARDFELMRLNLFKCAGLSHKVNRLQTAISYIVSQDQACDSMSVYDLEIREVEIKCQLKHREKYTEEEIVELETEQLHLKSYLLNRRKRPVSQVQHDLSKEPETGWSWND